MVAGVAPATMAAAAGGGVRWSDGPEGEEEGGGVPEDGELTRSAEGRSERGEELGNGGNGDRCAVAGAGGTRTIPSVVRPPGTAPSTRRERSSRRSW